MPRKSHCGSRRSEKVFPYIQYWVLTCRTSLNWSTLGLDMPKDSWHCLKAGSQCSRKVSADVQVCHFYLNTITLLSRALFFQSHVFSFKMLENSDWRSINNFRPIQWHPNFNMCSTHWNLFSRCATSLSLSLPFLYWPFCFFLYSSSL